MSKDQMIVMQERIAQLEDENERLRHPRDYGLGNSGKPIGHPTILQEVPMECPHCGCPKVFHVTVTVAHPMLRGGIGETRYLGCAACPWASPALAVATTPPTNEENSNVN